MKCTLYDRFGRVLVLGALLATVLGVGFVSASGPEKQAGKLRIGTYDSRAIAVAFAHSEYMPVAGKMRELDEAKAAGDTERVKELEAWFPAYQRELHRMGFCRVPVDDLLKPIQDRLAGVALQAGVDAIVFDCNYSSPDAEVVDVTRDLVSLYDPDDEVWRIVDELVKIAPISLEEMEKHHDH
jgi:hypothetical protein